jgi:hypothetical protein
MEMFRQLSSVKINLDLMIFNYFSNTFKKTTILDYAFLTSSFDYNFMIRLCFLKINSSRTKLINFQMTNKKSSTSLCFAIMENLTQNTHELKKTVAKSFSGSKNQF